MGQSLANAIILGEGFWELGGCYFPGTATLFWVVKWASCWFHKQTKALGKEMKVLTVGSQASVHRSSERKGMWAG